MNTADPLYCTPQTAPHLTLPCPCWCWVTLLRCVCDCSDTTSSTMHVGPLFTPPELMLTGVFYCIYLYVSWKIYSPPHPPLFSSSAYHNTLSYFLLLFLSITISSLSPPHFHHNISFSSLFPFPSLLSPLPPPPLTLPITPKSIHCRPLSLPVPHLTYPPVPWPAEGGRPMGGGGGGMNGPRSGMRAGDWECQQCQFHNFASRDQCFKCSSPKCECRCCLLFGSEFWALFY